MLVYMFVGLVFCLGFVSLVVVFVWVMTVGISNTKEEHETKTVIPE